MLRQDFRAMGHVATSSRLIKMKCTSNITCFDREGVPKILIERYFTVCKYFELTVWDILAGVQLFIHTLSVTVDHFSFYILFMFLALIKT
jgi:hypothetical protein